MHLLKSNFLSSQMNSHSSGTSYTPISKAKSVQLNGKTLQFLKKTLFSGASRPIRRGKIFSNNQPQKKSFFRHFKKFQMSLMFHQLQLDYWTSATMTKG